MGILSKFNRILNNHPMMTQMIVSGGIVATGDIIAQYIEEKQKWDKIRTFRFATLVGCCIVPFQSAWYRYLQCVQHSNLHLKVAKRLAYDQLVFSPLLNILILTGLPLAEGYSWKRSIEIMKEEWLDIFIDSLKLWPAVQIINFYFVPLNYRVLLIQFVGLVWSTYLSLKTSRKLQ